MRRAFPHVAVAAHHSHFARHHDVSGALNPVRQRFATAIEIIELRLGHRIVHIDGRHQERAALEHLVEAMHARGGLFGNAPPFLGNLVPALRVLGVDRLQQILDDLLFVALRRRVHPVRAIFQFIALVDEQRRVTTIVDDQLRTLAARMAQRLVGAPPVVFERLAFPGEHRHTGGGNRRGSVVLRREDVAARPAHRGAQISQRFNQHCRLNGHVQRAGDAHAGQRLGHGVLLADRHQAGHFRLGDGNLLAAPVGKRQISHLEFRSGQVQCFGRHADSLSYRHIAIC